MAKKKFQVIYENQARRRIAKFSGEIETKRKRAEEEKNNHAREQNVDEIGRTSSRGA